MDTLLELIHEYRTLRTQGVDGAVDRDAHARLLGLRQLLGDGHAWKEERASREDIYPVRFTTHGRFARGEVRFLNGAGLVVASKEVPPVGARLLVRLDGEQQAVSYVFPAVVSWARRSGYFGVIFDGEPERADERSFGAWSPGVLGATTEPMVA